jgi:hypothetical protein
MLTFRSIDRVKIGGNSSVSHYKRAREKENENILEHVNFLLSAVHLIGDCSRVFH